jgi:uncharacterized protein (TIGR02145 family)
VVADFLTGGGVQYYVRAYAVNAQGIAYGEVLNFITIFGVPTVSTRTPIIGINTSALCGGNVTDAGGFAVTSRGVCWGTSPNPTISGSSSIDGGAGNGLYSATATNLLPNTIYYIRAYATNSAGTAYGQDVQVNTATFSPPVTDIDGNVYGTVVIGTQTWMAENLKTNRYKDGSSIPYVLDNNVWSNLGSGAWCYYNHDNTNNGLYGKLYNWYAVTDARGLCPAGWHVPTDSDLIILGNYLGGLLIAGGKLKAVSSLWSSPNNSASNQSGFSALPSGFRRYDGPFGGISQYFQFWATNEKSMTNGQDWYLIYLNENLTKTVNGNGKAAGLSVRCLKD